MNYKVSVIIPVYNVEKYVGKTIESVIKQNINFRKNVEIILVNDGSVDNSEKVCLKYRDQYPDNIKYFYKKNSGVSDTRNFGYSKSSGKYIMFLDADDLINKCSLKYTSRFLDKHDEVDFVISRVRFFDSASKWHYMDYRFKSGKKIVDINEDITYCQYHSTGILIRRESISDIKFDGSIKFGEDMKFMSTLIFKKGKFGIEKRSMLYYRKRQEETSASQTQLKNKSYYLNTMEDSFKWILDESKKRYGQIPSYFKYYIMNSISERFVKTKLEKNIHEILTDKEFKKYIDTFMYMLKLMGDDIILMQNRLSLVHKYYLMNLLHDKKYKIKASIKDDIVTFNDISFPVKKGDICRIKDFKTKNDEYVITLSVSDYIFKPVLYLNDKEYKAKETHNEDSVTEYYDINFEKICEEKTYEVKCKISEFKNFKIKIGDEEVFLFINPEVISHNTLPCQYKKIKKDLIIFKDKKICKTNKLVRIKMLLFKVKNVLYIVKRDGLRFTLHRIMEVIYG